MSGRLFLFVIMLEVPRRVLKLGSRLGNTVRLTFTFNALNRYVLSLQDLLRQALAKMEYGIWNMVFLHFYS